MSEDQKSREEFEAHMLSLNACARLQRQREALGGHYRTTTVQRAWDLWQASRRTYRATVLEEAAKLCEGMRDLKEAKEANDRASAALERGDDRDSLARLRHHSTVSLFNGALEQAAKAIRALAGGTKEG